MYTYQFRIGRVNTNNTISLSTITTAYGQTVTLGDFTIVENVKSDGSNSAVSIKPNRACTAKCYSVATYTTGNESTFSCPANTETRLDAMVGFGILLY